MSRAYGMSAEPCRCVVRVAVPQFYAIGRESPEARRLALAFSAARIGLRWVCLDYAAISAR